MNKLSKVILILVVGVNAFWTNKLVKFAKESEIYMKHLELKTKCLEAKSGMDQNDIYLASKGLTREKLKGQIEAQYLPVRTTYDTQNEDCNKYVKSMCWTMDLKDPENVERCHSNFMTDKEYEVFKKTGKSPWESKNGK